ncbi:hypothetical protein D9M70_439210 [compost metagenome]
MASKAAVDMNRVEQFSRVFVDPGTAAIFDLSSVRLLRCAVDTVRQLYHGLIRPEVLALFEEPGMVEFAGHKWHSGRVGRDSGYQFKLQNADLGFILLIKAFSKKADSIGPHLKIEVSPHAIDFMPPGRLQEYLDRFASAVMTHVSPNQCAVHLALDVQGWNPPADLVARLHCRARAQRSVSGIDQIHWAANASVYGRGETFMFGSPDGVQLCVYNKTEQAKSTDKLDYWQSVWRRSDNPFDPEDSYNYEPALPVWRVELRYHHSIVQQFADGSADFNTGAMIDTHTFAELAGHLDGLWRYGLEAFRLVHRPGYLEPFWSLIRLDVRVSVEAESLIDKTGYKRHYKTAAGFSGKNVELFIGNFVSLLARERHGAKKAFARLKEWECWPVIRDHYAAKGKGEKALYEHIRDLLEERHVRWGRAI